MRSASATLCLVCTLLLLAAPASACPVCDSGTGEAVREGIGQSIGIGLLATLTPIALLLGVVAMVHLGWPGGRRR